MASEPESLTGDPGADRPGRAAWGPDGPVLRPAEGFSPSGPGAGYPSQRLDGGYLGQQPASAFPPAGDSRWEQSRPPLRPAGPVAAPGYYPLPARAPRRRRRAVAALAVIAVGLAGLAFSGVQVQAAMSPRKFTPAQASQIMAWEVAARWRELPAGDIFPASTSYTPPQVLQDGGALTLTASRLGIARQATCQQAADLAAAAVLDRSDCQAMLRSTYVDGTGSYLVTVGVAAFPAAAQAAQAQHGLSQPGVAGVAGVQAATFAGTPAAGFQDQQRQLWGSLSDGPYVVLYTIGYADGRPKVPVSGDSYTDGEMTSMGRGLATQIARKLAAQPPAPHCPGSPGC